MFCPKCGKSNEGEVKFCAACGAAMVDNQPNQQNSSLDSIRKGGNEQLPKIKNGIGNIAAKTKTLPKMVKLGSLAMAAFIIIIIALGIISAIVTNPKNIVKGYFEAKTSGDWGKMFDYLSLDNSEFINRTSFAKHMENEKKLDVINFKIIDLFSKPFSQELSSEDSDFFKVYEVEYLLKGNTATKTETITLVRKIGKKYLFYDDYSVNAVGLTCSDYRVNVPKGAAAFLDDIELTQTSNGTFIVPEIFLGKHSLRVEHPQCEIYTEEVYVYGGSETNIQSLTIKDEVKSAIARQTEETYSQMIYSALAGNEFDTLNLTSVNDTTGIEDSYSTLATILKVDADGVGCKEFTVTRFIDKSSGIVDIEGTVSCVTDIEYNYITISKDEWTGKPIEFSDSGSSSVAFSYAYENDIWVLLDGYVYGMQLEYGESTLPYVEIVPFMYDGVHSFEDGLAAVSVNGKWGFINKAGKEVVSCKYDGIGSYHDGLNGFQEGLAYVSLNVVLDGRWKWGLVDKNGREVVPCIYSDIGPFSEGLAMVSLGNWPSAKYGFIDKTGQEVIPCIYDYAYGFSDGMALISIDGKYGFIDKTGRVVISCVYDYVFGFTEGLALVRMDGKYGFIDKTGRVVISCVYDYVFGFTEGLALVRMDGKYGFIDKTGHVAIPCIYDDAESFFDGLAKIGIDGKMGLIDKAGQAIVPMVYDYYSTLGNGLVAMLFGGFETGKWGIINKAGREIVPLKYDSIYSYSEDMAMVFLNGKYGFIDKTGREVAKCIYDEFDGLYEVYGYCEGMAVVSKRVGETVKYGFIDKTGREIVPCKYNRVSKFSGGLAQVSIDGEKGFIDKTGKEIFLSEFEELYNYSEGLAAVKKDGKWGFIAINT